MDSREPYDWTDDEAFGMDAVLKRFDELERARVSASTTPATSAGPVVVLTKRFLQGDRRGRPTFA